MFPSREPALNVLRASSDSFEDHFRLQCLSLSKKRIHDLRSVSSSRLSTPREHDQHSREERIGAAEKNNKEEERHDEDQTKEDEKTTAAVVVENLQILTGQVWSEESPQDADGGPRGEQPDKGRGKSGVTTPAEETRRTGDGRTHLEGKERKEEDEEERERSFPEEKQSRPVEFRAPLQEGEREKPDETTCSTWSAEARREADVATGLKKKKKRRVCGEEVGTGGEAKEGRREEQEGREQEEDAKRRKRRCLVGLASAKLLSRTINLSLQCGAEEKVKRYACLVYAALPVEERDLHRLRETLRRRNVRGDSAGGRDKPEGEGEEKEERERRGILLIKQKTPLRVLHRRSLATRQETKQTKRRGRRKEREEKTAVVMQLRGHTLTRVPPYSRTDRYVYISLPFSLSVCVHVFVAKPTQLPIGPYRQHAYVDSAGVSTPHLSSLAPSLVPSFFPAWSSPACCLSFLSLSSNSLLLVGLPASLD